MKTLAWIKTQLAQLVVGRQLTKAPSEWLYLTFNTLGERTGIAVEQRLKLWLDVAMQHNEPHRHYHHLSHLYNLLRLIDAFEAELNAPDLLRWAVWYHDYIYQIGNPNNEEQSAKTAYNLLSAYLSVEDLLQVQELILATATHQVPALSEDFGLVQHKDCALFLDFDLAILAAPHSIYKEYSAAVEKEYTSLYELEAYKQGRAAFLQRFLQRPQLYFSPAFAQVEDIARQNIGTEV
jgi:predicted metal-dependent HD superfamily phosphohydrolase